MLWVKRDQTSDQRLCRARLANRDSMNPDAILACRRALQSKAFTNVLAIAALSQTAPVQSRQN